MKCFIEFKYYFIFFIVFLIVSHVLLEENIWNQPFILSIFHLKKGEISLPIIFFCDEVMVCSLNTVFLVMLIIIRVVDFVIGCFCNMLSCAI